MRFILLVDACTLLGSHVSHWGFVLRSCLCLELFLSHIMLLLWPSSHCISTTIDHIWDIDLLSIPGDLFEYNDGFTFILGAIDIFSRFAFTVPIKNKTAAIVLQGFKDLLASTARSLHIVRSDAGREFNNKSFQTFLKDNGITHFTNSTLKKANYIECWFRTIKVKFFRYLHNNNTKRFIDKLPEFVSSYNNTFHRILKASPSSVNYKNDLKFYWAQKER